ncbi:hypothetical protein K435DRAFT_866075 [Dendrothele bispora CBS 962.96]|uniref:BTB domain-containing protein n=1 Tax=Dendrothele bispora (strain CBS 962.96) TaxID=1314807 RepID=A0A4S8LIK1_DENBC|nr:hypothetical protein K435DRAFT_866075 [Dendrothele bispora CBS 962.96]
MSDFFKFMFEIPAGEQAEGTCFEKPIIFPCKADDLDNLFAFLFHRAWKDPVYRSKEELISLGTLAQMWDMSDALQFVTKNLDWNLDFTGPERLYYAQKFGVPKWAEKSVRYVLTSLNGAGGMEASSAGRLAVSIVVLLMEGEANLIRFKKDLARDIPPLPKASKCPDHSRCEKALLKGWNRVIHPAISKHQGPLWEVTSIVEEHSFSDMSLECAKALHGKVKEAVGQIEGFVCAEAGKRVENWLKSQLPSSDEK